MKKSRLILWSLAIAVAAGMLLWSGVRVQAPRRAPAGAPEGGAQATRAPRAGMSLADLPAEQGRSLGAAMKEARHTVWKSDGNLPRGEVAQGEVLKCSNPAQRYAATFTDAGARVEPHDGAWHVGLTLVAFGAEGNAMPAASAARLADGRRVEYRREGLVESYENTDEGLEHGFTIARRPDGGDSIEIVLEVCSELEPRVCEGGRRLDLMSSPGVRVASYCKLAAFDVEGRKLPARMVASADSLSILVDAAGAVYPVTVDPLFVSEAKVTASDAAAGDWFGNSVSVSGDTAIVGVRYDDDTGVDSGSAYVFVRSGASWSEEAKLIASDGAADDWFGYSVSVSGDTALVGAFLADVGVKGEQGAAYVFVRSGGTWSEQQKLTASDGAAGDRFGYSVSVSGETTVVGALMADVGGEVEQGAAYVFIRSGGTWSEQQKLTASDGAAGDWFGVGVSLSGETAMVGARQHDVGANGDQGSAYVFVRSGAVWSEQQKLTASDGAASDWFGGSVSLSGDTAVVGARQHDVGANGDQGSAYVFVRSGAVWSEEVQLTASDGAAGDEFGYSVSVSGDTAVVGAPDHDVGANGDQGSAYVFVRTGAVWSKAQKLTASDGAAGDEFGYSVSVCGDTAVVGAPNDDDGGSSSGSAYFFDLSRYKSTASDGAAGDCFGISVSVSGDTAVVGAGYDDIGANADQGSAYVFVRTGASWSEQAKLTASDGAALDYFGISVSVSGDTAVVGAPDHDVGANADQGSAYVFVRTGAIWSEQQKLTASDGAATDVFGHSVSLSGDTVIVSSPGDDDYGMSSGSAYVFVRSGASWSEQAKLTASDGAASDNFGWSVSLSGDTAVVGARLDDVGANGDQGSAYVFVRSGVVWSEEVKLTASDGAAGDWFGYFVSVSGDTAVAGAVFDDDNGGNSGSAYVFVRSGAIWREQQKLRATDGAVDDQFGYSVSVSGDTAIVGANQDDDNGGDSGSAYVFVRSGVVWSEEQKLTAPDGAAGDNFGCSVSVSGDTAVVGAFFDDDNGGNSGSAYFFDLTGLLHPKPAVTIAATDASADETGGQGELTFTRTGPTDDPLVVFYAVSGTAANGVDYNVASPLTGTVTIAAGSSSAAIAIDPAADAGAEGAEAVTLAVQSGTGYVLGHATIATVVIADDPQVVTISANDPAADETGGTGQFTVTRTGGDQSAALVVNYATGGTAVDGTDYVSLSGTVTIAGGSASETIDVTPVADALVEGDETVSVTISPDAAYVVGSPSSAQVTIADNPQVVTISANDPAAAETGDPGQFTVTRTGGDQSGALVVNYTIAGTAENGVDYNPSPPLDGTVTIGAGQPTATIDIAPVDDLEIEGAETVLLTLSSDPAYVLGAGTSDVVVITEDEQPAVVVVATDAAAVEDVAAPESGVFTIYRTGPTTDPLDVNFTLGGTATEGNDYTAIGAMATIPAGSGSVAVVVAPLDDSDYEGQETVELTLGTGAYAIAGTGEATVLIADDEQSPRGGGGGCAMVAHGPAAAGLLPLLILGAVLLLLGRRRPSRE